MPRRAALLLALAVTASAGQAADDSDEDAPAGISPARAEAFARALQDALRRHDVDAVAALVRFPLRVNGPGKRSRLFSRAQFTEQFDAIFPPAVVAKVLQQDPAHLFQRDQGIMFGNGEVWASGDCIGRWQPGCPVRVHAVNRPDR